jgi:hypothetical protein
MSVHLTLLCHAATGAVRRVGFPRNEPIDPQARAKASEVAVDFRRSDGAVHDSGDLQ